MRSFTTRLAATFLATVVTGGLCGHAQAQHAAHTPGRVPGYYEQGPALGITGRPFRMDTPNGVIRGVSVQRDTMRRRLYREDYNGRRRQYQFRTGYDVILDVNYAAVRSPSEVLQNTRWGWNDVRIWDRRTGRTATYQIWLD